MTELIYDTIDGLPVSKSVEKVPRYKWKPMPSGTDSLSGLKDVDIPREWLDSKMWPILKLGILNEHILLGWNYFDYIYYAALFGTYETAQFWGIQGSTKSNDCLRSLGHLYRDGNGHPDWDLVLQMIIFKPQDFVSRMRRVPKGVRLPALMWDDIGVWYPSSTFRTDVQQYEAIDAVWATIRVKCSVIVSSLPIIDRLAKNIKDNLTFEIYLGPNRREQVMRIFRLPKLDDMSSNLFKVILGNPSVYPLEDVPFWVYKKYEDLRLTLSEEALEMLDTATPLDSVPEGYIPLFDAARLLKKAPSTLGQEISRGYLEGIKFKKRQYVNADQVQEYMKLMSDIRTKAVKKKKT